VLGEGEREALKPSPLRCLWPLAHGCSAVTASSEGLERVSSTLDEIRLASM